MTKDMQLKNIKIGKWYKTNRGVGCCTRVGGTFPPSVQIDIKLPVPQGILNFSPRDVAEEADDPLPPPVVPWSTPVDPERHTLLSLRGKLPSK